MFYGCLSRRKLVPGFLKDECQLASISLQEHWRETIWTGFLAVWAVQDESFNLVTLDVGTTLAEISTPLVKQILAMQRRKMSPGADEGRQTS